MDPTLVPALSSVGVLSSALLVCFVKNVFRTSNQFSPELCDKPQRSGEATDRIWFVVKATVASCMSFSLE